MRALGQRALGLLGPPPRRGPAPSGTLTFGCATQRREHGELSPCCGSGSAPSDAEGSPGAPSRRLPGRHGPGATRAAAVVEAGAGRPLPMGWLRGLPAGGRGLAPPRSVLSALALYLPRGGGGALGPQVGGVGLRDLQYAAHGADRPHQLLGRGCGLRHGTRRLRAAPRGGPGRG